MIMIRKRILNSSIFFIKRSAMLKVFILLSFLLIGNSHSLRSEASEMADMKKMFSLMQSQINLLRNKEGISKVGEKG